MDPAFVPVLSALVGVVGGIGGALVGGFFCSRVANKNIAAQERLALQRFQMERRERQVAGLLDEAKLAMLQLKTIYIHASAGEDVKPVNDEFRARLRQRDFAWIGVPDERVHTAAAKFFNLANAMQTEMGDIIAAGFGQYTPGFRNIPMYYQAHSDELAHEFVELTRAVDRYVVEGLTSEPGLEAHAPNLHRPA